MDGSVPPTAQGEHDRGFGVGTFERSSARTARRSDLDAPGNHGAVDMRGAGSGGPSSTDVPVAGAGTTTRAHRIARTVKRKAIGYSGIVALLLFWHVGVEAGVFNRVILPPPLIVRETLVEMLRTGELIEHVRASVSRIAWGFTIAAVLGILAGVVMGMSPLVRQVVSPVVELIRPISPIAWIPLAILWFGIGDGPGYFVIFLAAFFPILVNTQKGVSSVALNHRRAAACCGIRGVWLARKVYLPSSTPDIMAGLRIGMGIAWMAVIAAELVSAQSGLGYLIGVSRQLFATDKILVGMVTIGVLGYLINLGMLKLERRLAPWIERAP